MDLSMLAWAPYLVGGAVLMYFPLGRKAVFWLTIGLPLLLLGLLLASESGTGMGD